MNENLKILLEGSPISLLQDVQKRILQFYDLVLKENERQNLTRLISPSDFYFGHVQDVLKLLQFDCLQYPAMDLGSGAGIPGLLAALIQPNAWILAESEGRKAEFLDSAVNCLGLEQQVQVFSGRAENFLKKDSVGSVVARAVGPVEKIYSWIRNCSTWNNLILLKGPSWSVEWEGFQKSKFRNELKILLEHSYQTGLPDNLKSRKIIKIERLKKK